MSNVIVLDQHHARARADREAAVTDDLFHFISTDGAAVQLVLDAAERWRRESSTQMPLATALMRVAYLLVTMYRGHVVEQGQEQPDYIGPQVMWPVCFRLAGVIERSALSSSTR